MGKNEISKQWSFQKSLAAHFTTYHQLSTKQFDVFVLNKVQQTAKQVVHCKPFVIYMLHDEKSYHTVYYYSNSNINIPVNIKSPVETCEGVVALWKRLGWAFPLQKLAKGCFEKSTVRLQHRLRTPRVKAPCRLQVLDAGVLLRGFWELATGKKKKKWSNLLRQRTHQRWWVMCEPLGDILSSHSSIAWWLGRRGGWGNWK